MDVKTAMRGVVDAARQDLLGLSHALHADPEVGFEEHRSSRRVAGLLEDGGFDVEFGESVERSHNRLTNLFEIVVQVCLREVIDHRSSSLARAKAHAVRQWARPSTNNYLERPWRNDKLQIETSHSNSSE